MVQSTHQADSEHSVATNYKEILVRQHAIPSNLSDTKWDIIIIGAGINGTGIARDAALRGLKVLLLEKEDISSGTSAWSSRLIHGGLRYLEYMEISLVREIFTGAGALAQKCTSPGQTTQVYDPVLQTKPARSAAFPDGYAGLRCALLR